MTGSPRIDAHQHLWDLARAPYSWLPADSPLHRSLEFAELVPSLRRSDIDATVLVQADDDPGDTAFMLEAADAHPEIVAVVAWAPLEDPEAFGRRLEVFRADPRVVGIRALIHEKPDPDWLLRPRVVESLGLLEASGLTFDLVSALPRHLEHLPRLGELFPDLSIVIDHLAKPPIGGEDREPWHSLFIRAGENPRVHAKVSGLYSASGPQESWTLESIRPSFEAAVEAFGPARLMYGGDWPMCTLAGGYDRMWDALARLFEALGEGDRARLLGGTASMFYSIDHDLLAAARSARDDR